MSARESAQNQPVPRDRLVVIGLNHDDRDLVVGVARGQWALAFDTGSIPIHVLSQHAHDTVVITSLQWVESVDAFATHLNVFDTWHGVILLPASATPEQQQWLVRRCPLAQVVITGQPGTIIALSSALVTVRHHVVASALAAKVGHVHSALVTRVLLAALSLHPEQSDVATLARAVHMHPRTLHRKLTRAHPPITPQRLLGWARLLHVAWYMRDPSRSVAQIAETLRWSAASNLLRLLQRYAGLTTNELRAEFDVDPVDRLITYMYAELELGES